jgi:flagellar basal body P-ring protein FlgI
MITDHARIRLLERVFDLDVSKLDTLLSHDVVNMAGDYKIKRIINGRTAYLVVNDGVVVTVTLEKDISKIKEDFQKSKPTPKDRKQRNKKRKRQWQKN